MNNGDKRWLRKKHVVKILQVIYVNKKADKAIVQHGFRIPIIVPAADLTNVGPL